MGKGKEAPRPVQAHTDQLCREARACDRAAMLELCETFQPANLSALIEIVHPDGYRFEPRKFDALADIYAFWRAEQKIVDKANEERAAA